MKHIFLLLGFVFLIVIFWKFAFPKEEPSVYVVNGSYSEEMRKKNDNVTENSTENAQYFTENDEKITEKTNTVTEIVTSAPKIIQNVNLNTATYSDFLQLLGDEKLANACLALRKSIVKFTNPRDLLYAEGMTPSKLKEIIDYCLV